MLEIRILGPGCPRCHELEKRTINALAELNLGADVQKVTDFKKIAEYKIFSTPALVINGQVVCSGRIPSLEEIKEWLKKAAGQAGEQ
jgi:small redox-active disulfide protein 2